MINQTTDTARAALAEACRARGIMDAAAFRQRFGIAPSDITYTEALALLTRPASPRTRDRAQWTPAQRERYVAGCIAALTVLRGRLERGLAILATRPTVQAEVRWFTLASRAVRLIAKIAAADREAEVAFLGSDLGRWYIALEWPEPSPAARLMDW